MRPGRAHELLLAGWVTAKRICASTGQGRSSSSAVPFHMVPTPPQASVSPLIHTSSQPDISGLQHQQNRLPEEGRASFPHYLPNYPVLGASLELTLSIFAACWPQVEDLGNGWGFSPKHAHFALPDLLVTARGSHGAFCSSHSLLFRVSLLHCRLHRGASRLFCRALSVLGQKLHFMSFCSTWGSNALPEAPAKPPHLCCGTAGQHQFGAGAWLREVRAPLGAPALLAASRRAGFCSVSRPPIQIQALLAPVKLSDNLRVGTVPCKQMGTDGPAAKSPGCSSGRGEREQSSSARTAKLPPKVTVGKAGTRRGAWFGDGVFLSGGVPSPSGTVLVEVRFPKAADRVSLSSLHLSKLKRREAAAVSLIHQVFMQGEVVIIHGHDLSLDSLIFWLIC